MKRTVALVLVLFALVLLASPVFAAWDSGWKNFISKKGICGSTCYPSAPNICQNTAFPGGIDPNCYYDGTTGGICQASGFGLDWVVPHACDKDFHFTFLCQYRSATVGLGCNIVHSGLGKMGKKVAIPASGQYYISIEGDWDGDDPSVAGIERQYLIVGVNGWGTGQNKTTTYFPGGKNVCVFKNPYDMNRYADGTGRVWVAGTTSSIGSVHTSRFRVSEEIPCIADLKYCFNGALVPPCTPEICDLKDNDRDGQIDEGLDCTNKYSCTGTKPTGVGLSLGDVNYSVPGYTPSQWTYAATLPATNDCYWTCAAGYTKVPDQNKCELNVPFNCNEPKPTGAGVIMGGGTYSDPAYVPKFWTHITTSGDLNACQWTCADDYTKTLDQNTCDPAPLVENTCVGDVPLAQNAFVGATTYFGDAGKSWTFILDTPQIDLNACQWSCQPGYNLNPSTNTCEFEADCAVPVPQTGMPVGEGVLVGLDSYDSPTHTPTEWTFILGTAAPAACEWRCVEGYEFDSSTNYGCKEEPVHVCGGTLLQDPVTMIVGPSTYTTLPLLDWTYSTTATTSTPCQWRCKDGFTRNGNACTVLNNIMDISATVQEDGNVEFSLKCSYNSFADINLLDEQSANLEYTVYANSGVIVPKGEVLCNTSPITYIMKPTGGLADEKLASLLGSIPQPCAQCTRQTFFTYLAPVKQNIPDNGIIPIVLVLAMAVFILSRKRI